MQHQTLWPMCPPFCSLAKQRLYLVHEDATFVLQVQVKYYIYQLDKKVEFAKKVFIRLQDLPRKHYKT